MTENNKNEKKRYKQLTFWFQGFLIFFLFLFVVGFVLVMLFDTAEECIGALLGLTGDTEDTAKNRILSFIGIAMGGILIALQALASYRRAKAMEDAANAQAAASMEQAQANLNIEKGQQQERLKNAIEHLGHDSDSVRLGGAYELFHLAEDNKKLRQTILDILCAHIRQTTSDEEYRNQHLSKPSEEIQSLLTLLFVKDHKVFSGRYINLEGSWLNGADLQNARLIDANLSKAYLKGTHFYKAKMQRSVLNRAQMQLANLWDAEMQAAYFIFTQLQCATLIDTQMQAARFSRTEMQAASFRDTKMQGANHENFSGSFKSIIEKFIDRKTDLSMVRLAGNMTENKINDIVFGVDDTQAVRLRSRLNSHIDRPKDNELPEGIITGSYTCEEAEQWIAEYNDAMSDVPTVSG